MKKSRSHGTSALSGHMQSKHSEPKYQFDKDELRTIIQNATSFGVKHGVLPHGSGYNLPDPDKW